MKPLSKTRFRRLLHSGHGRAALHVRRFGLDGVADMVLDACLHDRAYDPQCEPSRDEWLFTMFENTLHYARFATAIVERLAETDHDHDLLQCCGLAEILSWHGDERAGPAVRRRVLPLVAAHPEHWIGRRSLIGIYGADAVVALARCYGQSLRQSPEAEPPTLQNLDLDPELGCEALLADLARDDEDLAAYLAYCAAESAKPEPAPSRTPYWETLSRDDPLQQILDGHAQALRPRHVARLGRALSDAQRMRLIEHLECKADESVCETLLHAFRLQPPDRLFPRLLSFGESHNPALREAAIYVLCQLDDVRVGELGRRLLAAPDFPSAETIDDERIRLLTNSLQDGDPALIHAALRRAGRNREALHTLGLDILHLAGHNASPALVTLLDWIYEHSPCSMCRSDAVAKWTERAPLPAKILEEGVFDADETIRELASKAASAAGDRF